MYWKSYSNSIFEINLTLLQFEILEKLVTFIGSVSSRPGVLSRNRQNKQKYSEMLMFLKNYCYYYDTSVVLASALVTN